MSDSRTPSEGRSWHRSLGREHGPYSDDPHPESDASRGETQAYLLRMEEEAAAEQHVFTGDEDAYITGGEAPDHSAAYAEHGIAPYGAGLEEDEAHASSASEHDYLPYDQQLHAAPDIAAVTAETDYESYEALHEPDGADTSAYEHPVAETEPEPAPVTASVDTSHVETDHDEKAHADSEPGRFNTPGLTSILLALLALAAAVFTLASITDKLWFTLISLGAGLVAVLGAVFAVLGLMLSAYRHRRSLATMGITASVVAAIVCFALAPVMFNARGIDEASALATSAATTTPAEPVSSETATPAASDTESSAPAESTDTGTSSTAIPSATPTYTEVSIEIEMSTTDGSPMRPEILVTNGLPDDHPYAPDPVSITSDVASPNTYPYRLVVSETNDMSSITVKVFDADHSSEAKCGITVNGIFLGGHQGDTAECTVSGLSEYAK